MYELYTRVQWLHPPVEYSETDTYFHLPTISLLYGITLDMILVSLPRMLSVITSIVNQSTQTGVFPNIWKEALVKPVTKLKS